MIQYLVGVLLNVGQVALHRPVGGRRRRRRRRRAVAVDVHVGADLERVHLPVQVLVHLTHDDLHGLILISLPRVVNGEANTNLISG